MQQENLDMLFVLYLITVIIIPFIVCIVLKYTKNINIFICSYKRVLTNMISDTIYELQFFQMISILKLVNFKVYNVILQNFFKSIHKYAFLDWFLIPNSKITSATSIEEIEIQGFTIVNEILLFIILFTIGVVGAIVFGLIRVFKCDSSHADNEKIYAQGDEYEEDENENAKHIDPNNKEIIGLANNDNYEKDFDPEYNFPQKDADSKQSYPTKNLKYNNQAAENKKEINEFLKNDKSNLSNNKLINTESNSNSGNNKSNLITNNIQNINAEENNHDISNLTDLNPQIKILKQSAKKLKNEFFGIREAQHKSLNYNQNKSKKNQVYLAKQDYIFTRFTYSSIRNYFFYSYFIRVYQLTLVRLVITYCILLNLKSKKNKANNNGNIISNQISGGEVFFMSFLFYVWVLLLPLVLLTYLRNHQNDLLSRKQIIKFGSLYLSYRGISKDIYAILMQVKFIAVPYACVSFSDVGVFIYYFCGFVFAYYICFVTISKPFSKVWKVFNESLSFLILIIFCISFILIRKYDENYKNDIYSYYTYLSLIIGLMGIRSFRIFIDTTKRVMEIMQMRMPKERDFALAAQAENNLQMDVLSLKLKEKVDELRNNNDLNVNVNNDDNDAHIAVKDEERKAMKEFEYDENAEYNVENMSGDDDEYEDGKEKKSEFGKVTGKSYNKFNLDKDSNSNGYEKDKDKDKSRNFGNNKNFFDENKRDLNFNKNIDNFNNTSYIQNNNDNFIKNKPKKGKIMMQNTNADESKAELRREAHSAAEQTENQSRSSAYVSSQNQNAWSDSINQEANNTEFSKASNSQYSRENRFNNNNYSKNHHHENNNKNNQKSYNSESQYSGSHNYYEDHYSNNQEDSKYYYSAEAEAESQISQTASNHSRDSANNSNSNNQKDKRANLKNSNFAAANKNRSFLDKKLTKIQEETNSQVPESVKFTGAAAGFDKSGRSNNSRAELNNEKSEFNERDKIKTDEDKTDFQQQTGVGNLRDTNSIMDDVNRDVSAERNEVLRKFKVKKNKKKNKF